jgi:hypothetical protein
MTEDIHKFHIPVMGTGHSIDTPIRVAPFGISSVISLVDDLLLERIRKHYCEVYDLPYVKIPRKESDGRAKRTTAYLNMVDEIVKRKFEKIRNEPFFADNDKKRYFEMLPNESSLKKTYQKLIKLGKSSDGETLEDELNQKMQPGSIDVNIMVKLDRVNYDGQTPLSDEFSDAKAALRGYANSCLKSCIVFSAGINQSLFSYMTKFKDFYRDEIGEIKKKITLKVSDYRSALIQGKFLARKGLEIYEFRVESGLNCGGHAFPSNGELLPYLLKEFKEKRHQLKESFLPSIEKFYQSMDKTYPESAKKEEPILTVQGGIGTYGEAKRLLKDFGAERTGWATPFLLVPEATCIDQPTLDQLVKAKEDDLYLSGASPLGIPFNNLKNSGSDKWTQEQAAKGNPGSACPKGFLVSNTEFSELPICTASKTYQSQKLEQIKGEASNDHEIVDKVLEKACICDHLGNGALIALGLAKETLAPQSICPGPNLAWFDRIYSLQEMVSHIYGCSESLVPAQRPHMYQKEIAMYFEWLSDKIKHCNGEKNSLKMIRDTFTNLRKGILFCKEIADSSTAYPDENLDSLKLGCPIWLTGLDEMESSFQKQFPA